MNLVTDQIFRYLFRNQSKNVSKASIEQDSTLHFFAKFLMFFGKARIRQKVKKSLTYGP